MNAPHLLLLACLATVLPAAVQPPCFETNIGSDLALSDDDVALNQALGFSFPIGNTSVSAVSVSSNGFVWLGSSTDSGCCNGNLTDFLSGLPRIAPLWTDLNPSAGGGVHFNTFPNRAVITWNRVPEYGESTALTAQLQMMSDGSITLFWAPGTNIVSHTTLVGITPGQGAAGTPTDLTNLPFDSGTGATVYQVFGASTLDLGGLVLDLAPNGNGGYRGTQHTGCQFGSFRPIGNGCPPATPLLLTGSANGPPTRNMLFQMVFGEAPPTSTAAFLVLGADAGGQPLDTLGMTGCRLYATLDFATPIALQGRYSVVSLPIPDTPWVVGQVLFAQTGILAPSANPAGIVVSNGGRIEIGS